MIRDKDRIYAEVNDPNTVLASGSLVNGQVIIGTGNKGVQTYVGSNKSLLYQDTAGNLNSLPYNQASKLIGTDVNGNLTLINHKYLHTITLSSTIVKAHFQIVTSDSQVYTNGSQVATALYNCGFISVVSPCTGVYGVDSDSSSIITGIKADANGNMYLSMVKVGSSGLTSTSDLTLVSPTINDIVTEL